MTRLLRRSATVAALAVLVALAPATAAHAAGPAVTVLTPSDGATVSGPTLITAEASTDPGDTYTSVTIYLDSTPLTPTSSTCTGDTSPCSVTASYDFTGDAATHSIHAEVDTVSTGGTPVSSSVVGITASSPGATATIGTVAPNPRKGTLSVPITGTTDASQTGDFVTSLELLVGDTLPTATSAGTFACAASVKSCSSTLTYDATGLSGSLTLWARVAATKSADATDVTTVTVSTPLPTVSITAPGAGATVKGVVTISVSGSTDSALTDFPKTITVVRDMGTPAEATVGTVTCAGGTHTCSGDVTWDSSTLTGSHTFDAHLITTDLSALADSARRSVTVSSPAPATAITSPVAAATVSGTVFVDAKATTDVDLAEYPATVDLYVDGTKVDTRTCDPLLHSCTVSGAALALSWDATGVTGSHVLTTVVTTTSANGGRTATSPEVAVTVTTPPYAVSFGVGSLDSRSVLVGAGATSTSSGTVTVTVTASTDSGQSELPQSIDVLVDAVVVASADCPLPLAHTCVVAIPWNAAHSAGAHRLAARVTTDRARTGSSASLVVYARSGARLTSTATSVVVYGGTAAIRGRVVSTTTGTGLSGLPVRIWLKPAVGTARRVDVRTNSLGYYALNARLSSTTRITPIVGNLWLPTASRAVVTGVRAPLVCSTASTRYRVGATGSGACTVRNLPIGTTIKLRYSFNGRWTTLASGRSSSTRISFTFRFPRRGTYYLQVSTAANKVYAASASRLMKVGVV